MNVFQKSDFFFWNLSHNAPLCAKIPEMRQSEQKKLLAVVATGPFDRNLTITINRGKAHMQL